MAFCGGENDQFFRAHDGTMTMGVDGECLKDPILIMDLTSPEVNRGSYCYLPYLLYSALKATGHDVDILEDVTVASIDMDYVKQFKTVLCSVWSYPQIETAMYIDNMLPNSPQFFGYYPLIQKLGLTPAYYTDSLIEKGMENYPLFLIGGAFEHILLSDCDAHLRKPGEDSDFTVYPFFTSYGCTMGCKFCSATVNNRNQRHVMPIKAVLEKLKMFSDNDMTHIHFTDEDFFFQPARALEILTKAHEINPNFQFIALGECCNVSRFYKLLDKNPDLEDIVSSNLRLIEIGLETADTKLAKEMGGAKATERDPSKLYARATSPILWLTVTFYPGETCRSINLTGQFLLGCGLDPADMMPRIRTNGTDGGLGQFYQFYHGCGMTWDKLKEEGVVLTERPMRLLPSFLPNSWLKSLFTVDISAYEVVEDKIREWLRLYNIHTLPRTIFQVLSRARNCPPEIKLVYTPQTLLMLNDPHSNASYKSIMQTAICIAIFQRLGVFEAAEESVRSCGDCL